MDRTPNAIEDLTPEWLSRALGRPITAVTSTAVGAGLVGASYRLTLESADPECPPTVVAKLPSEHEQSRNAGRAYGNYRNETGFYRDIASTVGIRVPDCYAVEFDPDTHDFVLLLEDLAPAQVGDQVDGCSVDDAAAALVELARLHAPWWAKLPAATFGWLASRGPEAGAIFQAMYQSFWPGFLDRFEAGLPPHFVDLGRQLGDGLAGWVARNSGEPTTVTHGDYRLDNLMFGSADDRVAAVDWQTVSVGRGTGDVAYFLGTSLAVDHRRAHDDDLLRLYWEELKAGGVDSYSWDDLRADYRAFAWSGVVMAVIASMSVIQDDRGDRMFHAMAYRSLTLAEDIGALDGLAD